MGEMSIELMSSLGFSGINDWYEALLLSIIETSNTVPYEIKLKFNSLDSRESESRSLTLELQFDAIGGDTNWLYNVIAKGDQRRIWVDFGVRGGHTVNGDVVAGCGQGNINRVLGAVELGNEGALWLSHARVALI